MTTAELTHLFSLTNEYRSIQYDLRNMQALAAALDNPQESFRSVLIAGTNGKGSVAAFLSAMAPGSGMYTSPHLVRLNERIRIGNNEISDSELKEAYDAVVAAAGRATNLLYPPTYFEMVTAMAFTYFRGRTRFAVVEVGMGGRLDATNIVQQDASVITSIGLDHQEFLGSSLDQIASEKAGIIKGKEPVIIGSEAEFDSICELAGDRLFKTGHIARAARPLGKGYFEVDITTPIRQYKALRPRLAGRHQIENLVVAIRTAERLEWTRERIEHGANTAQWPGRLELIEGRPSFLLDGAHNEPAAAALAAFLGEFYPERVYMIFGCMRDKNYPSMLDILSPHASDVIFTRARSARSQTPDALQRLIPGSRTAPSIEDAIACARAGAPPESTILICGSLYLVGEARALLK